MSFFKELIAKLAVKFLQNALKAEPPLSPPSRAPFPIVDLPIQRDFRPNEDLNQNRIVLNDDQSFQLGPGDYEIPVMAYCMHSMGISPGGHLYRLVQMKGAKAHVIRALNSRGLEKYQPRELQTLLWAIEASVPYHLLEPTSQKIIDDLLPEYKAELSEDFLTIVERKWNATVKFVPGAPTFVEAQKELFLRLGEFGKQLQYLMKIREEVRRRGARYETFASFIEQVGLSKTIGDEITTPWSELEQGVYGRFLTRGRMLQPGLVQVRIARQSGARIDVSSVLADPQSSSIQTLSLSGLVLVGPLIAIPPLAEIVVPALLILIAIGAWDKVAELLEKTKDSTDPQIKEARKKAEVALAEAHDKLEKPARDVGVLDGAKIDKNDNNPDTSRVYDKPGGQQALEQDFDKIPGTERPREDGIRVKDLPDGSTVVARPKSSGPNPAPTLEIQPPEHGTKIPPIRVKIRYR